MSFTMWSTDYSNAKSIGSRLRAKRIAPLLSIIDAVFEKKGRVEILDVGGRKAYWGILPEQFIEQRNIHITLLNLPAEMNGEDSERFKYLEGDACDSPNLSDNSFDIVHCNSGIEHVGDWSRMVLFANEIKRLAKIYYVQTPYFWFPIEPHCMTPFFHWLPKSLRVSLIMRSRLGHWAKEDTVSGAVSAVESARLLDIKMFKALFQDADISLEKILMVPKSMIAIKVS